ncbi:MAG TPA: AraC family transcriptional regulator [Clostridia bacterium]|nr:AraC family transcriptional regulator [Clostridia bacterium]
MGNIVHHGLRAGPGWCLWRTPAALIARYALEPALADFLVTCSGYFPRCWRNSAWRPEPLPLHEAVVSLCVEGRGWVKDVQDPKRSRVPVLPGEILVIPSDTPHSYGADEKDPWTQLWFHATGPRLASLLQELRVSGGPFKGRVGNVAMVRDSLHRINELRRQGCGRSVLLESAALGQLVLARLYAEASLNPALEKTQRKPHRPPAERVRKLERITRFLQENWRNDLSLPQVANACHVSESWLYHAFAEHAGFSPLGFVIHLRLQEACRLLATTNHKLQDIATAVGYEDPFYFSRLFSKHIGMAPSAYREQYSQGGG